MHTAPAQKLHPSTAPAHKIRWALHQHKKAHWALHWCKNLTALCTSAMQKTVLISVPNAFGAGLKLSYRHSNAPHSLMPYLQTFSHFMHFSCFVVPHTAIQLFYVHCAPWKSSLPHSRFSKFFPPQTCSGCPPLLSMQHYRNRARPNLQTFSLFMLLL